MADEEEQESPGFGRETRTSSTGSYSSCQSRVQAGPGSMVGKDTCVRSIYEAVQSVPEALEIVEQYMVEKEILLAGDPNKEILASELVERLMGRFRGEIQDELGNLYRKFTHFVIQPDEKVCTGIDRLNGIIQKLILRGNPPTDEAKLAKLKEALEVNSLNQLWLTISLRTNPTYAEIVATCKRYDKQWSSSE